MKCIGIWIFHCQTPEATEFQSPEALAKEFWITIYLGFKSHIGIRYSHMTYTNTFSKISHTTKRI